MFPNVRLIIVAMLASMASICCCLGVFAAFRVNHEPFTRSQSSNPPLQLVFGNGAPAVATDGAVAPFGVRFAPNVLPATRPIPTPAPANHPAADTLAPDAAGMDASPTADEAAKQDNAKDVAHEVAVEVPADPSPPAAAAAVATDTATVPDNAASADAETNASAGTSIDAKSDTSAGISTEAKSDTAIDVKPDAQPIANTAPKTAATPARKMVRHRIARVRRIRRPLAATAIPSPDLNFPLALNYQLPPQAVAQSAPQAVKRRVVSKRHRPAKAAAVKRAAPQQTVLGRSTAAISR
jgi:hypothetical protein